MIDKKNEKTILFISPHLDDVVFSCGGTLAKMKAEGWRTILCTVFTKSVADPKGFALACQLDKNLAADVDYMRLRRAEDYCAAKILNVSEVLHLNFSEAPHRGYNSAAEIFAGVKNEDEIWKTVAEHFDLLNEIHQPQLVFAPQGLGNHCDHVQTIRAVVKTFAPEKINWYRDTPYAIRQPNSLPFDLVMQQTSLAESGFDISSYLEDKIAACAAYESQIGFQFGGRENLSHTLTSFHTDEAKRLELNYEKSEAFLLKI